MSKELRRRLHEADPNLKIAAGRVTRRGVRSVPRVLSPTEAKQWGLPEMLPVFPSEEVLAIEAMYSKKELEELCINNYLEPQGDKDRLIQKLLYVGVMDENGKLTGKLGREEKAVVAPSVQREMTFNDVKHELVGSFKTEPEVKDEASYWRKRGYRARMITTSDEKPFHLYVSVSRRK